MVGMSGNFDMTTASMLAFKIEQAQDALRFGDPNAQADLDGYMNQLSQIVPPDVADDPMARAAMIQGNVEALQAIVPDIVINAQQQVAAQAAQLVNDEEITGKPLVQERQQTNKIADIAGDLWGDDMAPAKPMPTRQSTPMSFAREDMSEVSKSRNSGSMNMIENKDSTILSQELLDDRSVQDHSHTRVETSDRELEILKMNIENEIRSTMAGGKPLSEAEAMQIARNNAMGTGIDPNLAATMGKEAQRANSGMDEMMNGTADGGMAAQNQDRDTGFSIGGLFSGFGALVAGWGATAKDSLGSVISSLTRTTQESGIDFNPTDVPITMLSQLSPIGPQQQRSQGLGIG